MEVFAPAYALIVWTIIFLAAFALSFVALIGIYRNDFLRRKEALLWMVVVMFAPFLGAILYFKIGRIKR